MLLEIGGANSWEYKFSGWEMKFQGLGPTMQDISAQWLGGHC